MSEDLDVVKELLGKTIRIELSDGRVVEGEFQCLDREFNFVLGFAVEYHGLASAEAEVTSSGSSRNLGMAMIPGQHIVRCLLSSSTDTASLPQRVQALAVGTAAPAAGAIEGHVP